MPMAMTTTGTINGESTRAVAKARPGPGYRPRTSPNAVSVPSVVARAAAANATLRLVVAPDVHSCDPKKLSYHRRLKPLGGKVNSDPLENDIGITIRVGAIRKTPMSQAHPDSSRLGLRVRSSLIGLPDTPTPRTRARTG